MSLEEDEFPELFPAVAAGQLDSVERLYKQIPPARSSKVLDRVAIVAMSERRAQMLDWAFSKGFQAPRQSLNGEFFHGAMGAGSTAIWQVLLDHGFQFHMHESEYLGDALLQAVFNGDLELAKWLLEHGHDPSSHAAGWHQDEEAITYAICGPNANIEMVKLMLAHKTRLEETAAVVVAAEHGNLDALALCLDYGADVNELVTWRGLGDRYIKVTALYCACRAGQIQATRALLDRGADANVGPSCMGVARDRGHDDVVQLLQSRGIQE